jgi:hypothetical protein
MSRKLSCPLCDLEEPLAEPTSNKHFAYFTCECGFRFSVSREQLSLSGISVPPPSTTRVSMGGSFERAEPRVVRRIIEARTGRST